MAYEKNGPATFKVGGPHFTSSHKHISLNLGSVASTAIQAIGRLKIVDRDQVKVQKCPSGDLSSICWITFGLALAKRMPGSGKYFQKAEKFLIC